MFSIARCIFQFYSAIATNTTICFAHEDMFYFWLIIDLT